MTSLPLSDLAESTFYTNTDTCKAADLVTEHITSYLASYVCITIDGSMHILVIDDTYS